MYRAIEPDTVPLILQQCVDDRKEATTVMLKSVLKIDDDEERERVRGQLVVHVRHRDAAMYDDEEAAIATSVVLGAAEEVGATVVVMAASRSSSPADRARTTTKTSRATTTRASTGSSGIDRFGIG